MWAWFGNLAYGGSVVLFCTRTGEKLAKMRKWRQYFGSYGLFCILWSYCSTIFMTLVFLLKIPDSSSAVWNMSSLIIQHDSHWSFVVFGNKMVWNGMVHVCHRLFELRQSLLCVVLGTDLDMSIGHFASVPFHGLSSSGPWSPETSEPCTLLSDQRPCL